MKRKIKIIIIATIFVVLISVFITINVCLNYPDSQNTFSNHIDEVFYIGNDNSSLASAFSEKNIEMKYYTQINYDVVNKTIIVDSEDNKIDYGEIKKLLVNNVIIFTNVTSTERIQKEILNKDSYDVLISQNDHENDLAILRKNQSSEEEVLIVGYYSYPDNLYNDFVEKVVKYSQQ